MMLFANPYPPRHSAENTRTPYNGEIPHGLQPGKQIFITGAVRPDAQQFRIDLITVQGHIALHINPRFNVGQVVRNSNIGGWGPEERHGPFPFNKGEGFEMVITCEGDHFKVAVNGQHNFDYNHRVPLQDINSIAILGDCDCFNLNYLGGRNAIVNEVYSPPVPSTVPIVGGMYPGKLIQIVGHVLPHCGRFEINLQSGPYNQPENISLHFNPRWNDPYSPQPITVRTHRQNGGWGSEDRNQPPFPFERGSQFEVLILCEDGEWKLSVNGNHYIGYSHNFPPSSIDHIGFIGDIAIESVRQYQ